MNFCDYLCDVNTLTRHIEYLMLRHDCVVIPGLGAFIAQYAPARIDESNGIIIPPARTLSFNSEIRHNDGILATSVSRTDGITFDAATLLIADKVAALKADIGSEGRYSFGHLGKIGVNTEGNLVFEPNDSICISPRLAGLTPTRLSPIKIGTNELRSKNRFRKFGHTMLRTAASIAVLVGLGIMVSTPIIDHSSQLATFGRGLVTSQPCEKYTELTNYSQRLSIANVNPSDGMAVFTPATETVAEAKNPAPAAEDSAQKYFMIVASLPTRSQAESFVAENGDRSLGIIASQGRYRVYAASGESYNEVYRILSNGENASKYPDAWIFRK